MPAPLAVDKVELNFGLKASCFHVMNCSNRFCFDCQKHLSLYESDLK